MHICQLSNDQVQRIRLVSNFKESIYSNLDISATLDFFLKRYVRPLSRHVNIQDSVVVDCASGYGWFSFAYLMAGGKRAIAVDSDVNRLSAAAKIAEILSVDKRIEFVCAGLQDLPFREKEVDIFVSIETLEHIGKNNIIPALQNIKKCTSKVVLLTTPNKLFPIVAHDMKLPFVHWFPVDLRRMLAKLLGREKMGYKNEFVSPFDLQILRNIFRPASTCMSFSNYKDYIDHYPFYLPYGDNDKIRWQAKPSFMKAIYFMIASLIFRQNSYWIMPSLSSIFVSK